jgi:hypothetical protein
MTRPVSVARGLVLVTLFTVAGTAAARAEVLFQNPGNTMGWDKLFTQKAGTIDVVSSPVFKGGSAVKTTQTYQSSDGKNYHSEIIKAKAHLAGQDLYYGHAVYLPPDWQYHSQNVTFQQWAPEEPEAPWVLMYLQGESLRLGGRGAMGDKTAGSFAGLKGTWINTVTRIHMATDGIFEVWINGKKTFSQRGNWRAHGPSMRWSNGIYATRWDTETPTGPRVLTFWHDNMRIATTYEEADPATWGDNDGATPGDGGAGPVADAGGGDMGGTGGTSGGAGGSGGSGGTGGGGSGGAGGGASGEAGGGGSGVGGTGGSGGAGGGASGGTGGNAGSTGGGTGGRPGTGGSGGSSTGAGGKPPAGGASSPLGCSYGGGDRQTASWSLVLIGAVLLPRRRRRR